LLYCAGVIPGLFLINRLREVCSHDLLVTATLDDAIANSELRGDEMRKLMTAVFLVLALSGAVFAKESQLEKANNVLNEIMRTPDKGIPHDLFEKAVCVGIVPSEIKGAFLVGGTYGRGVLVCRRHGDGPWGAPSLFSLGAGSFGFQIGGESTDVVFLVMNGSGARKLVQDEVKLGADVSVTAGPVGRSAEGATDAQLHAEILSYSRTRGLFAGVSLEGAVFKQDKDANRNLYGRDVTAKEILIDGEVRPPVEAAALEASLARYSPRGGHPSASLRQQ
jgi:lipid-binding SYLF domain-containing protein